MHIIKICAKGGILANYYVPHSSNGFFLKYSISYTVWFKFYCPHVLRENIVVE